MKSIEPLLRELAAKLGTTMNFLWEVLIKQARVTAIQDGVFLMAYCLFIIATIKFIQWGNKKKDGDGTWFYRHEDATTLLSIIGVLGGLIFTIITMYVVGEFITCLVNPQYWALKEVCMWLGK